LDTVAWTVVEAVRERANVAVTLNGWLPLLRRVVSSDAAYGALVRVATTDPSTRNATVRGVLDGVAVHATVPESVEPFAMD
jgi:hypothetical protein